MRIGILSTVGPGYSWSGSEEMWKLMAVEALKAGHTVAVCMQSSMAHSEELAEFKRLGGVIFPYQPLNWIMRRLASKGWYSRFGNMRRWEPDLLCVSGGPCDPFWQRDSLAFLNANMIPKVYILQGNEEGFIKGNEQRSMLRPLFTSAARIISVSRTTAVLLERQLAAALPHVTILPNPIRLRLAKPLPWPDIINDQVHFATVGRYDVESKCQDRTFEAFATSEWKSRNWHLSLYGTGSDEVYLHDLIRYYGLQDHITIEGYERNFQTIWAQQHLHILNSRCEGLSLALIESMFCGRPAVVTRSGGHHELVRDGLDGFVTPGNDPEIIRETLERAWVNRGTWRHMGESAFGRAAEWIPTDLGGRLLKVVVETAANQM
jgi:glycosyltransferase involved in cell wall biosynthesis